MKLTTTIRPRRDGTVRVGSIVFAAQSDGSLVADVDDDVVVLQLLDTGYFEPADTADFARAAAMVAAAIEPLDDDGPDDAGVDSDDDESPDALPVEANTPPQPARKKGPRKAPRE
jgi:hypothetical protein